MSMHGQLLEEEVFASIRRIIRAVDLYSRQLNGDCGLTGPQLATLSEVTRRGATPAGTLARSVHLGQSTLTGILDRLERRGLVARTRNGVDRRSIMVEATEEGTRMLQHSPSLLQERFLSEFRKLQPWEQTQMLATLQRVADMMHSAKSESLQASELVPSTVSDVEISELHLAPMQQNTTKDGHPLES